MFAQLSPSVCKPDAYLQVLDDHASSQWAVQKVRALLPEVLDPDAVHVIPVSGGADSSALAILMVAAFPDVNFRFMFTDTGSEGDAVYESLDRLEVYIGRKIERVSAEKTLYGYIEEFNGFLPSSQKRWCTRALKLLPYKQWIRQFGKSKLHMYVGVRHDEDRVAFVTEGVETIMPFVTLGLKREAVFSILSKTIGIPRLYKQRTRSGCTSCPFLRQGEVVALLSEDPGAFERGKAVEKLSVIDVQAYSPMPEPYWQTSGLARNWLGFPQPDWRLSDQGQAATRGRASLAPADLFGGPMQGVWVAVEFFVNQFHYEPIVWRQELVTISTTRAGLQKQLDMHMQHRLSTAEVWDLTEEQMREEARYVIYYLNVDAEVLSTQRPGEGSYTWQSGQAYARTEHLVRWAQAALWSVETGIAPVRRGKQAPVRIEVLGQEVYEPKAPSVEDTYDERYIACPMCSI